MALDRLGVLRRVLRDVLVAAHHHLADHPGQAHALAILGAVDAADAVGLQLADFGRHDHAAAAAEHLDVGAAACFQQVDHVLEILDVAALVGADRDALDVFLQGGRHHVVDATVVAQVDHLGAHALQDAPHDVDRRVMPVEQAGGRDEADLVGRAVVRERLEFGGQVGHGFSPGTATLIDVYVNVNLGSFQLRSVELAVERFDRGFPAVFRAPARDRWKFLSGRDSMASAWPAYH